MDSLRFGKGRRVLKLSFCLVDLVVLLCGVALLVLGVIATGSILSSMENILSSNIYSVMAVLMIAAGTIVIIVSLLGFGGVLMENRCVLFVFTALVLSVSILFFIGSIAHASIGNGSLLENAERSMNRSLKEFPRDPYTKHEWNALQKHFQCCGVADGYDWREVGLPGAAVVPSSCCSATSSAAAAQCQRAPTGSNSFIKTGCFHQVQQHISHMALQINSFSIGLGVFLTLSMCLASCVVNTMGEPY